MHAEQLVGAPVIDSDGQAVGTVEQVFRDDVDGTPSWARIRSARGLHFVPLAGGSMTSSGGLSVPFDAQKIMKEPGFDVDRHMSVEQEDELRKYFGLTVPAQAKAGPEQGDLSSQTKPGPGQTGQAGPGSAGPGPGPGPGQAGPGPGPAGSASPGSGTTRPDMATPPSGTTSPSMAQPGMGQQPGQASGPAQASGRAQAAGADQDWIVRSEERFAVNMETRESGRVKLHKRVETEPVRQNVHVFREEYEIERVPITKDDKITGQIAESDQEIILHETRAVVTKETVPVERIRLSVKRIDEEQTVSDQLRKERIEIDSGTDRPASASPGDSGGRR